MTRIRESTPPNAGANALDLSADGYTVRIRANPNGGYAIDGEGAYSATNARQLAARKIRRLAEGDADERREYARERDLKRLEDAVALAKAQEAR